MRKARGTAPCERPDGRLARPPVIERYWHDDRDAQLAALRIILGLPRRPVTLDREAL
jgi:hypothetical protein